MKPEFKMKMSNRRFKAGLCAFLVSSFSLFSQEKETEKELAPSPGGLERISEEVNESILEGRWPLLVFCSCENDGAVVVSVNGAKKSLAEFVDNDFKAMKEKLKGEVSLLVAVISDARIPSREEFQKIEELLNDRDVIAYSLFRFRSSLPKEK